MYQTLTAYWSIKKGKNINMKNCPCALYTALKFNFISLKNNIEVNILVC